MFYFALVWINRISLYPVIVQTLTWTLPYDMYNNHLVDQAALVLTVTGRVSETKQVLATQFNFRLCTSDITITVSPQVTPIGKQVTPAVENATVQTMQRNSYFALL